MANTERIPQGGALTKFSYGTAAQNAIRDPKAAFDYYSNVVNQSYQNLQSNLGQKYAQANQGALFPRSALLGGALLAAPGLMSAAESASEGRTLEAGVTAAGTLGSAAVASQLLKGPLPAKIAGAAIGIGGGLLSGGLGQMAERTKAAATGQEIAGQPGSGSARRGQRLKEAETDLAIFNQAMDAQTQQLLQLTGAMNDQEITMMQRQMPLINQMKDRELARNQALMNTMTGNYARLGMLATAGKLATGAQAERGATMRTALQSNPYSGAIMQAPSISF